jgi:glycosyltransferase involved in cell wall biosynthesis
LSTSKNDISIVIPCYNTPAVYLQEAIESVRQYSGKYLYDIILVNDGSTNKDTITYLETVDDSIKVIRQENKGLAGARNTGIRNSGSEYLLFLDGDDRIKPGYIERGLDILMQNVDVGVVYSKAEAFGDGSRSNLPAAPFDIATLLISNHIPSCAVIRRKAWEDAGGFDEDLRRFEDWEFWISVYKAGWKFYFIKEPMFEYRILENSLIGQSSGDEHKKMIEYIYKKHWALVYKVFYELYATRLIYREDMKRPVRSFFKFIKARLAER